MPDTTQFLETDYNRPYYITVYDICNIIASSIYSCPSIIFQYVAIRTLQQPQEIVEYLNFQSRIFTDIKNLVIEKLKNTKLIFSNSQGAWYILLNFDAYKKELSNLGILDSHQLSKYLIEIVN